MVLVAPVAAHTHSFPLLRRRNFMRLDPRPRLALLGTALAASVLLSVTLGAGLASAASTDYVSQ